jgi:hypothetical protein
MPDLNFRIESAGAMRFTASPTLMFKLRVTNAMPDEVIHSVALRCQIQLEVARRQYTTEEQKQLAICLAHPSAGGRH